MNFDFKRMVGIAFILVLFPTIAHAHPGHGLSNGWQNGFSHPWHGWDHLLAMFAVGVWAAQQRGRAVWLIPLTFVGVMSVGGAVGAARATVPGVELAISLSLVTFVFLVARRVRPRLSTSALLVGFFAFFHGFAHGTEMPEGVGVATFGLGFITATLLLHALGLLTWRLVAMATAGLVGSSALAQTVATNAPKPNAASETNQVTRMPMTVVNGRDDSLVGIATSATQGTVGATELAERPILRSGEILETVPGVIITQHAGGGKANQYFLRGFNLDHGTDFAVFIDDMPLNLPSHAHGEGYSDMNTVIPEFVQRLDYEKGPYYANVGNYGSAGSAHLVFYEKLPQDFVTVEGGMFGYERGVFGLSQTVGSGTLLYGGEAYHDDGPWVHPDNYSKYNGIVRYSEGDAAFGFSVTARVYHGKWNSSDQLAENSVPIVGFFGTLNPTDGGNSERFSLQGEWHREDVDSITKVSAYGFYYSLDLFSDFTYYLIDPSQGDQFEQRDNRWVAGIDARHTRFTQWFDVSVENSIGLQIRNDWIDNGLYQTDNRVRVDKYDALTDAILPAITQADQFTDTQVGLYAENKIQWTEKLRTVAAIRGDLAYYDVTSLVNPANSGTATSLLPSPKVSLIVGPWDKTEFYAQGGFDFHSNDGRGATQNVEPVSADNPYPGTTSAKIPGLIQTKGAEIGVRSSAVSHWQSTLSLWWLHSDSELQQDGDTGGTVASKQPSNRYGIEWANYYTPVEHLTLDLDIAESSARFTSVDADDAAPGSAGGNRVPEAVGTVISSGITLHDWRGFGATLRLRHFGPRDLTSDGIYRSASTLLLNAQAGYQINQHWRLFVEALNLLNSHSHDIDYAYTSRITPTAAPAFQNVFHPVEPFQVRVGVTATF